MTRRKEEIPDGQPDQHEGARIPQSELEVVSVIEKEHRMGIPLQGIKSVAAAFRILTSLRRQLSDQTPIIQEDLSRFVVPDETASTRGLYVVTDRGLTESKVDKLVYDRIVSEVLPELQVGSLSFDYPTGAGYLDHVLVEPLRRDGPDAFILALGRRSDNPLDQSFAKSLGVEQGMHSRTVDVVLANEAEDRFKIDFNDVARRLQGVYGTLDSFYSRSAWEPFSSTPQTQRPALTGERLVSTLIDSELPEQIILGVKDGTNVLFGFSNLGKNHLSPETYRLNQAWAIEGTTVSGPLRMDSGSGRFSPPMMRFSIGKDMGAGVPGSVREATVNPRMITTIRGLSRQIKDVFPVAA